MSMLGEWTPNTKFVEYGAKDGLLGTCLLSLGFDGYLGVSRSREQANAIAASHPRLSGYLATTSARSAARKNNADVLILSGRASWNLLKYRNLRHAEHVAWRPAITPIALLALLGCAFQLLLGRFGRGRLVTIGNATPESCRLLVFKLRHPRREYQTRRYIPHSLGVQSFLDSMVDEDIRHAVLRWFETLPTLAPGEDLDLLIGDEALERVGELLNRGPGILPCDLYTVTGLPGSAYRDMPYFPPYLAEELLNSAVMYRGICRVPPPREHFLSLAFHALYHKGIPAGLPHENGRRATTPEHDYEAVLANLATKLDIECELSMESLDAYLDSQGWRPPTDYLARLAKRNEWLRDQLNQHHTEPDDAGLSVFVIREHAIRRGRKDKVLQILLNQGFSIIKTKVFTDEETKTFARQIRGGNWGRGPWKVSGGPPAMAVVTYDSTPIAPTRRQRRRHPGVSNARLLWKRKIRRAYNEHDPPEEHCNVIHSSDNGHEAWDYIRMMMPAEETGIQVAVENLRTAFATDQPVLKLLTRYGRRAKVELINFKGQEAIKKTFKPLCESYRDREATALVVLSEQVDEIPPLLADDENSVVVPYYDNVFDYQRSSGKLVSLDVAKQAIAALRRVYDAGYALVDASLDNILIDRKQGMKLIDFEFAYRYKQKPATFAESYDIVGCPADFDGDRPVGGESTYNKNWLPYIGLSLDSLLHDPTWLQHVKRVAYVATRPQRYAPRRLRHYWRMILGKTKQVFPGRQQSAGRLGEASGAVG